MVGPLRWLVPSLNRFFARFSRVSTAAFLEPLEFPWVAEMELSWAAIRKEADFVYAADQIPGFEEVSPLERLLTTDRRWKTFFFVAYGLEVPANCRRCPETWQALLRVPGLVSACFSILERGKELPTHRGVNRGVLRYHLGVRVPSAGDGCALIVDGQTRRWREGGSLLFDDTYPHSAYNHSNEHRIVLFADVTRPLRFPANMLHSLVVKIAARSRYMRRCKGLVDQWNKSVTAEKGPA